MYLVKQGGGAIHEMCGVEKEDYFLASTFNISNNGVVFAKYATQEARDEEMRSLIIAIRSGHRLYQFSKDTQIEREK